MEQLDTESAILNSSMMTYEEALGRLCNHASFPKRPANLKEDESLLYAIWKARNERTDYEMTVLWEDVLSCLEAVNKKLNGEKPSATALEDKAIHLDRVLVIAVSTILHQCSQEVLFRHEHRTADWRSTANLAKQVWRLSCAWDAVLAGDIDSLADHIALEKWAREI